jgi:AcrR family transcriptional regulator
VHDSQRARLVSGMAESVAAHGYATATVADVLKRVHVSRDTFYQHFADKETCFLAVLDESARLLAETIAAEAGTAAEPVLDRLERVLTTYVTALTEHASYARVFFVESHAAGLAAHHKRVDVQERFVDLMTAAFADSPEWRQLPDTRFACRIVVGGISSLVSTALVKNDTDQLRTLGPQVVALLRRLT